MLTCESTPNSRPVAYLHSEGLGSTQFVTAGDGSLAGLQILDERSYDVWGAQRQLDWPTNNTPLPPATQSAIYNVGYTGHEADPEFGLINMQGRIYDPQISKFTTADPFVWHADSQGLNRYAYVLNNPLSLVDPSGFLEGDICAGACGIDSMGDIHPNPMSDLLVDPGTGDLKGFDPPPQAFDGMASSPDMSASSLSLAPTAVTDSPLAGASVDTGRLYSISVTDVLMDVVPVIASMLPGVGEVGDVAAVADVRNSTGVRVLATFSLALSVLTLGISPNVGAAADVAGGICFAEGTLVHTEDGLRPIEEIDEGELVWARDEATGEIALREVLRTFVTPHQSVYELLLSHVDGDVDEVHVTAEHPFYARDRGWTGTQDLKVDDEISLISGEFVTVVSVARLPERVTVYNIEVESTHTYFVGEHGAWVHNQCAAAARAGVEVADDLLPLTAGNFRSNLGRLTGGIPDGAQAHHVFPQQFADEFGRAGINIHDPRFGAWWAVGAHQRAASAYNAAWGEFLRASPSSDQIVQFGRDISARYGLSHGF